MDQRRAAGALLALVVCIASTAAAPTASNQTALDLYEGSPEGCYYNFQHYGEGDRIMTNEPCLNCTCHNRMLMCYLRVCPFTKPIGQDCTVEKRADQCCPIVTCPDVPVDLLTSTSTTSPAEYGATGVGKLDKYGCSINGKYFPEGSKVPPTPNKPCEHCYCIRNMTTCVMQECTLHVDGCTPIYHKDVCCPVRYSCDHPEDSTLLLDDMTTTVRPTPGFLLTTTTLSPVTQMTQDCVHDDQIFPDGALIKTAKACEHCYCMKGDIVCVVQECGTPMENEGKNCTSQPPREGQCCPDTYICEGDEVTTEPPSEFTTQSLLEELTTLTPPRRVGVEGSGYRKETEQPTETDTPLIETEPEGSGYEEATELGPFGDNKLTSETPKTSTESIDESLYSSRTTVRTPTLEEIEKTTEPDKGLNTVPSDASDEEIYKPSITEQTPVEEPKVTETILSEDKKTDDTREKTPSPDNVLTPVVTDKSEESPSTTESAFRKDDVLGEPTEVYDLGEPEKVSTQAADIETETEEDVTSSKTQAPFMEELEKQTTTSPEFTQKDIKKEVPSNESTTESVLEVTTPVYVKSTDAIVLSEAEPTQPIVEKGDVSETTSTDQNEIEDISTTLPPARIPGEGDCLLNDITYRNNSNVPSTNNCHTRCRCVSSIIKCDPIICSPPPEYMDNCQPTYDTPDSCCPTYVCHTGETIPPQPHSQMSGTESPLPSPSIECHDNECEVRKDNNVPVVGDCGPSGCGEGQGISEAQPENCQDGKCENPALPCIDGSCEITPSADCQDGKCKSPAQPCVDGNCEPTPSTDCQDGKCESPAQPCIDGNCELTPSADCQDGKCENPPQPCIGSSCEVTPSADCQDGKCENPPQPCIDGNCEVTPIAHCENGKCGIEPEIVPVKDKPLCDNESDCKAFVPQVPSCEGEECAGVNASCTGTECTSDSTKLPSTPGQDKESCKEDCKTPEGEITEMCVETSCRRKETGEVDSSIPSECVGPKCIQQVTSKEDDLSALSTVSPGMEGTSVKSTEELDMTTKSSEDASSHELTETIEHALKEGSTSGPLPEATEHPEYLDDKLSGTTSSELDHTTESQLDKEATDIPQMVEKDSSTLLPNEPEEIATKIHEGVDIQSPVTETPKVESEESIETSTTKHTAHSESTASPQDTDDIRTSRPAEYTTSSPKIKDTTELPEDHGEFTTKATEQEKTESVQEPDQTDIDKVIQESVTYPPEIDMASTKLPESDLQQDVTESHSIQVMDSSHDATESNEVVEKTTETPEFVDSDEHKITTETFHQVQTTEGAVLGTESQDIGPDTSPEKEMEQAPFTNAPTESYHDDSVTESVTKNIVEASTAETSSVSSESSEPFTVKQDFTESPGEYITKSQETITKQPAAAGQEPRITTAEIIVGTEESISEEDMKSQTTLATSVIDIKIKDDALSTDAESMEQITTPASISEDKPTVSETVVKPASDYENKQPTESSESNEVTQDVSQESTDKAVVTESSDILINKQTSKIPVDDFSTDIPAGQDITEQQEISTEEPSVEAESSLTDKEPSEPYIPLHPGTTPVLVTSQPDMVNEIPDSEPYTDTPVFDKDVEIETEIPDHTGLEDTTESPERMGTESPAVKVPDTVTDKTVPQQPELYSETPAVQTEEETQSTRKPFEPEMPSVSEVPEKTPEAYITEQEEKYSVTTEKIQQISLEGKPTSEPEKYATVSIVQDTTVYPKAQQESFEQSTNPEVTESDTSYATSAPESHVKESQKPVTESFETFTTVSQIGVSVTEEKLMPDESATKEPQEIESGASDKPSDETPSKEKPGEIPEITQDVSTRKPEEASTVLLEIATESAQEVKPQEEEKKDSVVTEPTQYTTVESHVSKVTEAISSDSQEKISTDGLQETMTTLQESSTRTPLQEITTLHDLELPERYTVAATDAPIKQETSSPGDESTEKQLEVEDIGTQPTTLKTPTIVEKETSSDQEIEEVTKEPTFFEMPGITENESYAPSPSTESTDNERATPEIVELEEHTHKPLEESSSSVPTEEGIITEKPEEYGGEIQKPQETTEKQEAVTSSDNEKISTPSVEYSSDISKITTADLSEIPHESTQPPSGEQDILTTSQPIIQVGDTRFGEDTSKEPQPTKASQESEQTPISGIEIPVQTERVPTEQVTQSELPHETLLLEEVSTTKQQGEEITTQKTEYGQPGETPLEEKPQEEGQKPTKKQTEKPVEGKPSEGPELTDKPLEAEERPTEMPIEEPALKPLGTETPLQEGKPAETTELKPFDEEAPTTTAQQKPQDATEGVTTEMPQEESDKLHEEKPSVEADKEPAEQPTESPLEDTDEKLAEKPEAQPEIKPEDETEEKSTEKPEDSEKKPSQTDEEPLDTTEEPLLTGTEEKPSETPEEKPLRTPEDKLSELPEEKPLKTPGEKPLELPEETTEVPEDKTQETPKEKPEVASEEKPEEAPEEKPQEQPGEQPQALPEEQPTEAPEEKPQAVPEDQPTEAPKEKPQAVLEDQQTETPEEKPQAVPEDQLPEAPEEKPQAVPEDQPTEAPEAIPHAVPEDQPTEAPVEKPQAMPEDQSTEAPEQKPQAVPEDKPTEAPEEKPQTVPEDQQSEAPEKKLQEAPEEKPTEAPEEKPQEVPKEKPQEMPEISEEKLQEFPKEKTPAAPEEQSTEAPEEKPQEVPEEKPQETPEAPEVEPGKIPEEERQEVPTEKPQEILEQKPEEIPEEKPQESSEEKPLEQPEVPEARPTELPEVPEEKPQEVPEAPERKPQEASEEKTQEGPEEKPQQLPEVPEEIPQEAPEEKPQEVPKEKPEEMPEEKPEDKPQEESEQKPQEVPEEKPAEPVSTASPETPRPGFGDMQPTDEVPDDDNQFPPSGGTSGYGAEPDYVEEDQAFGPGTCRYGGKVYVSAQQIPRDDPCDFCFCFRSDIICLQQSCPPPIHGCHEEPIQGFCCPRYECPVAMATTLNVTTTTTTTTTTLPPHFLPHAYKGAAQRRGCQIKGHTYKVGEVVRASSGPCLHCTCGGDGQMKCDPKACTPEPMLRQMIAAAVSAKRRR